MRTPELKLVHDEFLRDLLEVETRFALAGQAFVNHRHVLGWAAEMSLVSAVTLWEGYLEELLTAMICRSPDGFIKELALPERSTTVTRPLVDAVFTGMRYLDIRAYEDFCKLPNRFLEDANNPFGRVPKTHAAKLDDTLTIRNHVVHRSAQSRAKYKKMLKRRGFAGRVHTPGLFLIAIEDGRSRLASFIKDMRDAVALIRPPD